LNSFSKSDVSLGIAFVVLEVLIATYPPPPASQGNTAGHHFVCSSFARRPRKKYARVSHGLTQVVPKIAHLAISMEPTPLLEKVCSCGLLPRLWLLLPVHWASIQSTFLIISLLLTNIISVSSSLRHGIYPYL